MDERRSPEGSSERARPVPAGAIGGSVRRVARAEPRLLRILAAYTVSSIVEWAQWVAVLVYAYEQSGPQTTGIAAFALLVPPAFLAPAAARAASSHRADRVIATVYAVQAVTLGAACVLAVAGAPTVVVLVTAAVPIGAVTFLRPAVTVVVPDLVVSPDDLVTANLLTGNADCLGVFLGPLLASALLGLDGPVLVFGVGATLMGVGAVLTRPAATHALPRLATRDNTPARIDTAPARLGTALRAVAARPGALAVLGLIAAQYVLIGGLDLLYVRLAFEVLDLGGAGPGLLNAAFGAGAVAGGLVAGAAARHHRVPVMVSAAVGIGVALITLGAWTDPAVVVAMLALSGIGRSLLDVLGRMSLQRSVPEDQLGSVFAVLEVTGWVGILSGTLLVQSLIAVVGVRAAAVGFAAVFFVVALACAAGARHADGNASVPLVELRLLRTVPLMSPLAPPVLERLARASVPDTFPAGAVIVAEHGPGDHYYVIARGHVDISVDGTHRLRLGRGDGFGEVALLAGLPQTATVVASTTTSVLTIGRADFLEAVVGHDAAERIAWSLARVLHPTAYLEPE